MEFDKYRVLSAHVDVADKAVGADRTGFDQSTVQAYRCVSISQIREINRPVERDIDFQEAMTISLACTLQRHPEITIALNLCMYRTVSQSTFFSIL